MRFALLPAVLLLLAAADPPASPPSVQPLPIQVDHPWARASAGNARNGAAFLSLTANAAIMLTDSGGLPSLERV